MQHETDSATGAVTTPEEGTTEEQFLKEYKKKEYPKPSLTADIAVFRRIRDGVELLLVRRARHPFRGCWALPGGFVNPNEDVIDAAWRELEEETGICDVSYSAGFCDQSHLDRCFQKIVGLARARPTRMDGVRRLLHIGR